MNSSQTDDVSHIDKLTGADNYQIWKLHIEVVIQSAGLDEIVYGDIKQEDLTEEKEMKDFIRKDARAKRIILASINRHVLNHIIQCRTSKEMYEKITKVYDRKNEDQVHEFLQTFFCYQYDQSQDVAYNISNLQNISFRLNSLKQNITDEMLISKIFAILPSEYNNFGTAWGSTVKTERTIDNLMTRLFAEETKIGARNKIGDNVAFNASLKKTNNYRKKPTGNQKCFICNKPGHFANCCPRNKTVNENEQCRYCKKNNHRSENCFFRTEHEKRESNKKKDKVAYITEKKENDSINEKEIKFYVDSGSSFHMINDSSVLSDYKTKCDEVKVAKKNQTLPTVGVGNINTEECILQNVIFAPCLDSNLLSVGAITENDGQVIFTKEKVVISKNDEVLEGKRQTNGLYAVKLTQENLDKQCYQVLNNKKDATYWHKMLGHLSYENIKKLNRRYCLDISDANFEKVENICEICIKAKQTRFPFPSERTRATRPLEIIHTDICKIEIPTWDGYTYILTCQDDFTCFKQIYLLKKKSETAELIKEYVSEIESKWTLPVYKIRCDNGGEYVNKNLENWAKSRGTIIDFTIAYTPQLNAKAERLNRSILDKTRALLFESSLPAEMWGEAARVACYILNRSPTKSLSDFKTPFEMWFGKSPNYERMHLFGCHAHVKILTKLKKLDSRSKKYCHVGYTLNGYRLWDENARRIIYSRDVIFEDKISEIKDDSTYDEINIFYEIDKNPNNIVESTRSITNNPNENNDLDEEPRFEEQDVNEDDDLDEESRFKEQDVNENDDLEDEPRFEKQDVNEDNEEKKEETEKRKRRIPNYLQDYVMLTYQEVVNGPDSEEWLKAIDREKLSLHKNFYRRGRSRRRRRGRRKRRGKRRRKKGKFLSQQFYLKTLSI